MKPTGSTSQVVLMWLNQQVTFVWKIYVAMYLITHLKNDNSVDLGLFLISLQT
jgi:hypothetical protein